MRDRLRPAERPASSRFTSIILQGVCSSEMPAYRPGGRVKLLMGVVPEAPVEVRAYAFDETVGALLAELDATQVIFGQTEITCVFSFPTHLIARKVCVVVEGRWRDGPSASCEMSFDLAH